jgi:MoaA/NifB/PqqE/SkfB family radical SAM enzyme
MINKHKTNLALKVTNWCNLDCRHCCERSCPSQPLNLMPIARMEKHVDDFQNLNIEKWNYALINGGEGMAGYFHRQPSYIKDALTVIQQNNLLPVVKTNATWGTDYQLRQTILKDVASSAYNTDKVNTLDISVDEFHDNLTGTANVIADVISSDYLRPAIYIELVGFATAGSSKQLATLIEMLKDRDINIENIQKDDFQAYYGNHGAKVFLDYKSNVSAMGRALDNRMSYIIPSGRPADTGHCLQIDNDDLVTLNYVWTDSVKNTPLKEVVSELIFNANHR